MAVIQDRSDVLLPPDNRLGTAVGLLMTYRCNLNCKYCYIQTKRDKDMNVEMAQSILEPFLLTNGGMLTIAFMGGETLLATKVIIPLIEWLESRQWNRKFRVFGSTNGTLLTNNLKKWLLEHNKVFTLGLSYDGLPSSQIDNRGNNNIDIDFFLTTWPKQPIQMTINPPSVNRMADGVIYLLERNAVVHPNIAYEGYEWANKSLNEYGRQLNILINYYLNNPDKPKIIQFVHDLNEYADNVSSPKVQDAICGAGQTFQVFDVDGKSYPCHILSPLVLNGSKLKNIQNGVLDGILSYSDPKCSKCPYVSSCPTCMACNYLYRGDFVNRDNTHCKTMKLEVKAFIKHEIVRLKRKVTLSPEDAVLIDSIRKLVNYEKSL